MTIKQTLAKSTAIVAITMLGATSIPTQADAGKWGCYRVTAPHAVNIRKKAWSKSPVLTTASKGTILVKWKAYCNWRGFWCPVQKGSIKGHASKKHLMRVPCP